MDILNKIEKAIKKEYFLAKWFNLGGETYNQGYVHGIEKCLVYLEEAKTLESESKSVKHLEQEQVEYIQGLLKKDEKYSSNNIVGSGEYQDGFLGGVARAQHLISHTVKNACNLNEVRFKKGDYIIYNGSDNRYKLTNGEMKLGKVCEVAECGNLVIEIVRHTDRSLEGLGTTFDVEAKYFRKATQEEVEKYTKTIHSPSMADNSDKFNHDLRVGDYVKYVDRINNDKIYKIKRLENEDNLLELESLSDQRTYFAFSYETEKMNFDERELSFIKENRKIGELKKGDIIKLSMYGKEILDEVISSHYDDEEFATLVCTLEKRADV